MTQGDVTPENMAISAAVQFGLEKEDVLTAYARWAALTSRLKASQRSPDFDLECKVAMEEALDGLTVEQGLFLGMWIAAGIWQAGGKA